MRKQKNNKVKEPESSKNEQIAHATRNDATRDDNDTHDDNDTRDNDTRDEDIIPSTPTTTTTRTHNVKKVKITPKEPPIKRKRKTKEEAKKEERHWLIKGVI